MPNAKYAHVIFKKFTVFYLLFDVCKLELSQHIPLIILPSGSKL